MVVNLPKKKFNAFISAFKVISFLITSVGVFIPVLSYFTNLAPPLFSPISWITSSIAAAVVIAIYYYRPLGPHHRGKFPFLIRRAILLIVVSIVLIIGYGIVISQCTVKIPDSNIRVQIGFNKYDWSLTDYGKKKKSEDPLSSPLDWMMDEGFKENIALFFWKPWTINAAGILLIAIFLLSFVLWTAGWSLIAKHLAARH